MKYIMVIVTVLALAGCKWDNQVSRDELNTKEFTTLCMDGVQYWVRVVPHKAYFAPRIDPETLMPKRCQ